MSLTSPILGLPYIQAAQAQKHVTHNEAIRSLDALVQLSVVNADLVTPPPAQGTERYIVPAGATGDWAGQDHAIALAEAGTWQFVTPLAGWRAWVEAETTWAVFDGTTWGRPMSELQDTALFGLGATASTDVPFVARVPAALWDAVPSADGGTGTVLQSLNRESATDDCGVVFQTGYASQALLGLLGDDQFRLRTSADGVTFQDALQIDTATGIAAQPARPRFKGHINYDAYVPLETWTTVPINTFEENSQNVADAVTHQITAPVSGSYLFGATLVFVKNTSNSTRMRARFLRNGTTEVIGSFGECTSSHVGRATGLWPQTMVYLQAGDTVELQAYFRASDGYLAQDQTAFWGCLMP